MKLEPFHDRLLVRPRAGVREIRGIAIPDVSRGLRPYEFGDVIAVGFGRTNIEGVNVPLQVKVGDVVVYPKRNGGVMIPIPGDDGIDEDMLLIREADLIGRAHDMPVETRIAGIDGRLLSMVPTSKGLPDSVYKNREEAAVAEASGFAEPGDFVDEYEPGDGPS